MRSGYSSFVADGQLMWRELLLGVRELAYPNICVWCRELHDDTQADFCPKCVAEFTTDTETTCPRCSSSVAEMADVSKGCPRCVGDKLHFESAMRMNGYQPPISDVILRMKQPTGDVLTECMAKLWSVKMAPRIRPLGANIIMAVPLHWRRRLWRGFNVPQLLAGTLAKTLKIPCRTNLLRRTRATPSQTTRTPAQRRENVRHAFVARRPSELAGKTILLVDDVLTTGSTLSDAARALKAAGVTSVHAAVIAHR